MSLSAERFGYAHFDFLDLPREGWLATYGEEARRFRSPAEIPSDGIFWCNLDWQHFHRGSSLGRMGHLRHASYLPIRPGDALAEFGLDAEMLGPEEAARYLALMFGGVMAWSSRLLAAAAPELSDERHFTRDSLRDDLLPVFPPLEFPRGDEIHALLEGHSYHNVSSTLAPYRKEAIRIIVRRPRLRHALDILASPSPVGPYRFLSPEDLGTVDDVVENDRPALGKLRLKEPSDAVFELYGFSNTISRAKRAVRSWAAHPEMDALRRMAEVELEGAWVGKGYRPLGSVLPEAVDPLLNGRLLRVSWSVGVACEAMWRSVLAPPPKARGTWQSARSGDISWQGLWARAADKLILFPLVRSLAEKGHDVSSYGFGWILCSVDEPRLDEFLDDAAGLGLLPRIADIPKAREDVPWGGAKLDLPLAKLVYGKEIDRLVSLDRIAASDPAEHGDIVTSVLS
jgi:hypothetical protein